MFKQRLLTTLILTPLVLICLYYANYWVLISSISVISLLCGWEWLKLIPLQKTILKIGFMLLLVVTSYFIHYHFKWWLYAGIVTWFIIFMCIVSYPKLTDFWGKKGVVALLGLFLLPLFAQSMAAVYLSSGKAQLVYLFFVVWAADIGAYLAGKKLGRHKLIPKVSPGKTWEGLAGGMVLAGVVAVIGYVYMDAAYPQQRIFITFFLVIVTIVGDLFISMLKRRVDIKDTGTLIPGHGGLLDRMDSLIAAAPFYYLLCCTDLYPGVFG